MLQDPIFTLSTKEKDADMPDRLNSGDRVIALAAAAQTAAIVAGAASGAIAMWIARHKVGFSTLGLLGGAVIGWIVGMLVGKIIFPATSGNVVITKVGAGSLSMTLRGNVVAALLTGLVVSLLIAFLTGTDFKTIKWASLGTSVVIGIILALLVSLT